METAAFVDLAADSLGWNMQYDPSMLQGSVTLRVSDPLGEDAVRELLERVLARHELTVVDTGSGLMTLVKQADAGAVAVPKLRGKVGAAGLFEVEIIQPEFIEPEAAVNVLSQMLTGRGSRARVIEGTGLIMISEHRGRMEILRVMLDRIDVPGATVGIRRVGLRGLTPEQAMTTLLQLGLAEGEGPGEGGLRVATILGQHAVYLTGPRAEIDEAERVLVELDASQVGLTVVYPAKRQRAGDLLTLLQSVIGDRLTTAFVDENNNAIIVTGPGAMHMRVVEMLGLLDAGPGSDSRALESVPVRYRPAEEVLTLLESLLEDDRGDQHASPPLQQPVGDVVDGAGIQAVQIEGRIQLAVDEMNNRILVSGFPADIDRVRRLVEELDIRQPQVFIEVSLVSLSEGESKDLGIQLAGVINSGNTLFALSSLFGLSDVLPGDSSISGLSGTGGTGVVLDPGDFAAVIRALENVTNGRSVSRPSILVNNNTEAVLDSVQEEPFLSQSVTDSTTTTGFSGSSNAGTQISVTPMITAGDQLSLQYSISLSAFTGESSDPGLPPPRQTNSMSSSVTIPDGFTVALGGFETESEGQAESGTPPLSWIPIFGELFKSKSESSSKSKFYIFIRASVSRDEQFRSLNYASDSMLDAAGIEDGWPITEPRVIR